MGRADTLGSCGVRATTTVSTQALLFMNNPEVRACAEGLAARAGPSLERSLNDGVERAYQLALGRPPSADEARDGVDYLAARKEHLKDAMVEYCLILLSTNEFIYIP